MINPTTHAITEFPVPTADAGLCGITAGPDGNIWFTESGADKIGMINPTPTPSAEFPIPTSNSCPRTDHGGPRRQPLVHRDQHRQHRDDQPDDPRHHRVPHAHGRQRPARGSPPAPTAISGSPRTAGNQIGDDQPDDPRHHRVPDTHGLGASRIAITAGPDGNLWFTDSADDQIGMINPTTHAISEFPLPTASFVIRWDHGGPRRQPLVHR